jgi:dolichol-phosphate mannosyltransferase
VPPRISVIVPVFNEAENVLPLAREITTALAKESFELVFVDDCSRDATWEKIRDAASADARVRGLRLQWNSGQSAAVWTGVLATESPVLATLDGDLQNDPADLPAMLAELERCDMVCGVRQKRRDTWLRRVSSRVARAARRAALGVDFQDTGCGLRVFKRAALTGVFGFNGLHRFLPILVHDGGGVVHEVPVNHRPRVAGVSKYGVWNRLGRGIVDLFALAWYHKRRYRAVPFARVP